MAQMHSLKFWKSLSIGRDQPDWKGRVLTLRTRPVSWVPLSIHWEVCFTFAPTIWARSEAPRRSRDLVVDHILRRQLGEGIIPTELPFFGETDQGPE